ncbi:MAG: dTDP-4-amino-4,6-dideoxygalactose transaminase [Bacteroidetes bacterium]|nr:dTDP-4-amino-4,6-dideoxygalactose transaminase [Bacteroidota bacterium]
MKQIPFNKPYLTGKEAHYIYQAVYSGKISGNGMFTKKCQTFFEDRYGFQKCLLTTSCTDALEMAAILANIQPGDEVIIPSYTFVSTALAFVRQGAKIVFADSRADHPGIDESTIEGLVTSKTKAIVPVHYAGVACDMDQIMSIAGKYNLIVIEDAAQAVDSFYKGKPLGGIGHFGCFSFHETKNIQCGEGGMLVINDERYTKRAEIIWEKGTNRAEFFRGEVNKYGWVDTGSSFLPSDMLAAFLYAQIENLDEIQNRRNAIWLQYNNGLKPLADKGYFRTPYIPDYAANNGHMFYLVTKSMDERTQLIHFLKEKDIYPVFHYQSLHKSEFYNAKYQGKELLMADFYTDCLLRLPLYYELSDHDVDSIINQIISFYKDPNVTNKN